MDKMVEPLNQVGLREIRNQQCEGAGGVGLLRMGITRETLGLFQKHQGCTGFFGERAMQIKVKKLNEDAVIPKRSNHDDAGLDLVELAKKKAA